MNFEAADVQMGNDFSSTYTQYYLLLGQPAHVAQENNRNTRRRRLFHEITWNRFSRTIFK